MISWYPPLPDILNTHFSGWKTSQTFCTNRPHSETQNPNPVGMHVEGGTHALVFQTCCRVLERIPIVLKLQRWYQDHLSLSFTVLLYHMQPDWGYLHIMSINCSPFFIRNLLGSSRLCSSVYYNQAIHLIHWPAQKISWLCGFSKHLWQYIRPKKSTVSLLIQIK